MEPKIPEWITSNFLKKSLESDDRYRDIDITDFKASPAAPAGNNYGGLVIRVVVNCKLRGNDHKLSVIVKGPLTEGALGDLLSRMKNSEPSFYNVFIPEANKLSETRFAPDNFYSPISSVVVLEDLKEAGYLMADRIKRLDFEHSLLYTKAAAAFHAASMVLYKENPEMIKSVCGENYYSDDHPAKNIMINSTKWNLECMAKNISDKKISGIVRDSSERMWSMLVDIHRPSCNHFNSLLQFDPWTTNMMFKYDSRGKVCDIKLLDFQNLFYSSPVHDLTFFIWFSTNDDVREHHLRDLYKNYLEELNRNLRVYSCPEINYDRFLYTVKMFSPLALQAAASCAAILNPLPADVDDMISKCKEDIAEAEVNPMERYYTEDFCQNVLPQMVDHLAAEGVFDYMETMMNQETKTSELKYSTLHSCQDNI